MTPYKKKKKHVWRIIIISLVIYYFLMFLNHLVKFINKHERLASFLDLIAGRKNIGK